mgnify:FL=1
MSKNERNWLETTCDYLQVVQQTKEEKYQMYDNNCTNDELIDMIIAQDEILSRFKGYKPNIKENLQTYERKSLIDAVIFGGELLDLLVEMDAVAVK